MADEIVKDYLGNPCKTTEAMAWYAELIEDAEKQTRDDPRAIASQYSCRLLQVQERVERLITLLEACDHLLPNDTDADQARAAIEATREFAVDTSNKLGECGALGLLALKCGHLWPSRPVGAPSATRGKRYVRRPHLLVVHSAPPTQS